MLLIVIIFGISCTIGLELNDPCVTPCNATGLCVPVRKCDYAKILLRKSSQTIEDMLYFDQSKCGVMKGPRPVPLVCCPNLLNPESCGISEVDKYISSRILGGEPTKLEEHPWAVLLIYKINSTHFAPKCGGSLLNSRFVLTASHCIVDIPQKFKLHSVRFNEWDALSNENCTIVNGEEICRQEYEVEEIITHPNYNKIVRNKLHDITILKLKEEVKFGNYVRPICLPFDVTIGNMPIDDQQFTVTGWGQTETQSELGLQLNVQLNGKSNKICNDAFSIANITLSDTHICVGGDEGKDSCKGDSGGPLMREVSGVWYQVGIVSFGSKFCGTEGLPGIYTNVVKYLRWITETVHESQCKPKFRKF